MARAKPALGAEHSTVIGPDTLSGPLLQDA